MKSEKAKGAQQIQEAVFFSALKSIAFQNKKNSQMWELKDYEDDDEMFWKILNRKVIDYWSLNHMNFLKIIM